MPSSVMGALQEVPGLGLGVSVLDMANQFELWLDWPLKGPLSKLKYKQ